MRYIEIQTKPPEFSPQNLLEFLKQNSLCGVKVITTGDIYVYYFYCVAIGLVRHLCLLIWFVCVCVCVFMGASTICSLCYSPQSSYVSHQIYLPERAVSSLCQSLGKADTLTHYMLHLPCSGRGSDRLCQRKTLRPERDLNSS